MDQIMMTLENGSERCRTHSRRSRRLQPRIRLAELHDELRENLLKHETVVDFFDLSPGPILDRERW
jgi:hypothetical protein